MKRLQTPLKMFFKKSPKKFLNKTVQSNMLWLTLNKISEKSFLQSAHKQGSPSLYPCTQTVSAVPKYSPRRLQFCTGYRI